jgi:hypothetical protein
MVCRLEEKYLEFEAAATTGDDNNNVNENINAIDKKIDIATMQVVI